MRPIIGGVNIIHPNTAHSYCFTGKCDELRKCIVEGVDIESLDSSRCSPLTCAVIAQQYDCMKILLDAGANPHIRCGTFYCGPPLIFACIHFASLSGRFECLKLLLSSHPSCAKDHDSTMGYTPLMANLRWYRSVEACRMLINSGADVNATDGTSHSVLAIALAVGDDTDGSVREMGEMLIFCGARLDLDRQVQDRAKYKHAVKSHNPGLPDKDSMPSDPQHWANVAMRKMSACRDACRAILGLRRSMSQLLQGNGRDALGLIARILWRMRINF